MMESPPKCKLTFTLIFFIVVSHSLGLVSFTLCIASETKRNKKGDLRWNGKLCHLPSSPAFGLGIASLVCLVLSQIVGNSILFKTYCSGGKRNAKCEIPFVARILLLISWLSFGIAVILLIVATSMSRRQAYGEGWLNGECYLVKGGIYVGSAILILVSVESLMGSALLTMKTNEEADQGNKIHAQTERGDT
ncbi:hypothetical protein AAZX31_01G140300 [Glycine max]|uniref:Transmembrane protein n=2 Tax=Glycine subgen. Soja TaxID=1462606 RepID=I1J867_SOYBN|nr:uncharacterized protein LOC114418657 [Glycine soja]XP_040871887.1 protein MODIFYING WALL LIGNIN-1 isoform X1 [Glycine max]KAG5060839.1 hypothetical protein JHK87_001868 [Glycine soja]KAG5069552.1 hypothetical protein JHK85_001929 [Glycine max]KAG5089264.1 hypothetical protein JHK86_001876 [Glycine max]KAH1163227.1 hypothetical protein GYH30_001660 [Glycine max]KAH1266707.1 hypothetical protein GmHk_01G002132 [Glycine max]|eukprot:XP_003517098.1 uncharacterized protein LOC100775915 isoform X1 [Glycine max]